jgi:hypothetical protein
MDMMGCRKREDSEATWSPALRAAAAVAIAPMMALPA